MNIQKINVDIPVTEDKISLKGTIYSSSNNGSTKPCIINLPALLEHRESYFVNFFSEKFAHNGYYVLSYDHRAHGETAKQTGRNWLKALPSIFLDIKKVISWLLEKYPIKIKDNNIYLFGRSLGAAIVLTHGFIDKRVKKLVALCARYDYHSVKNIRFPEDVIKNISPIYFLKENQNNKNRIFLSHCKDDPQIPFKNLELIARKLSLPENNLVIYENGGHSFKNHRDELLQKVLEFLKN